MKRVVVLLFLSLFLVSCGQKLEQKIVGQWRLVPKIADVEVFSDTTIEFFSDYTYELNGKLEDDTDYVTFRLTSGRGKWVVLEDGRLKLDPMKDGKFSFVSDAVLSEDDERLTLTFDRTNSIFRWSKVEDSQM